MDEDDGETVEFTTSKDIAVFPTFEAMGLKEDLLRGIYSYGRCLFLLTEKYQALDRSLARNRGFQARCILLTS